MKFLLLTLLLASFLMASPTDNWLHDYDKALQLAQKENKNIYVFIGADVCRFCDLFKQKTLSKQVVIQRLQKDYITLYLSRDRHKVPKKFEKFGVPRHYFLNKSGKIIYKSYGVLEPAGFFTILDEADLSTLN